MSKKYTSQLSFFDHSRRVEKVDEKDKLKFLNELIPWETVFRERAREAFGLSGGGRPSFDELKMFKVLVLQRLYGLSDEEMEFSLNDRLSFQRFVGFGGQESIPDEKTIWLYRERLTQSGKAESLFKRLERFLVRRGYRATSGVIVDATVVELPRNGTTDKEVYQQIKAEEPEEEIEPNASRRSQIDFDARYTSKDKGKTYLYGYKAHTRVCAKFKLIRSQVITEASRNENAVAFELMEGVPSGTKFYADSAYDTLEIHDEMRKRGLKDRISKQSTRNKTHAVKGTVKVHNSKMARTRCRIEHVFGHIKHVMHGGVLRCVGQLRSSTIIILNHLAYNLQRFVYLERNA